MYTDTHHYYRHNPHRAVCTLCHSVQSSSTVGAADPLRPTGSVMRRGWRQRHNTTVAAVIAIVVTAAWGATDCDANDVLTDAHPLDTAKPKQHVLYQHQTDDAGRSNRDGSDGTRHDSGMAPEGHEGHTAQGSGAHHRSAVSILPSALPSPILAAYANWGECDDKLVRAVDDGVNVLIWFSINLGATPDGKRPLITGPATGKTYLDCVANKVRWSMCWWVCLCECVLVGVCVCVWKTISLTHPWVCCVIGRRMCMRVGVCGWLGVSVLCVG